MKDGERGIIYGMTKRDYYIDYGELKISTDGHDFNVIKIDGKVFYKDGQIGREAIFPFKHYKEFKY